MGKALWIAAWLFLGVSLAVGGQSVTVVSPNGGETWNIGSNRLILWNSSGPVDEVRISLVDPADNPAGLIAIRPAADGSYLWHVGNLDGGGTAPTGQYRIRVKVVGQQVSDRSDGLFTIAAALVPKITVTSPNGGENWDTGTTHAIAWTASELTAHVAISLVRGNGDSVGFIVTGLLPDSSPYSWTVGKLKDGSNAPLGTDYKISVGSMGT